MTTADSTADSHSDAPADRPLTTAPVARRSPTERVHHGHTFIDDYEWLRDKQDPTVRSHLEAENDWTAAQTRGLGTVAESIFDEISARTLQTDLSVPVRRDSWWYYSRTIEGQSYAVHCRAPLASESDWTPPDLSGSGPAGLPGEEILLDSNAEAKGRDFYSLGSFDVSPDGGLVAWAVDYEGDERYTLRVKVIATGAVSDVDVIPNTSGGALFSPDGGYLFYCTVDDAWRPDTVWRHELGTEASDDVTVFHEPDDRYWVGVGRSRSRRFLVIDIGSKITSEVRILPADDPTGQFRVVWPRRHGVEYDVEHAVVAGEDRLIITHNDGAENFEVVDVSAADPEGDRTVVVPHSDQVRIDSVEAFASHLVVSYRRDVLNRVGIIPLQLSLGSESVLGNDRFGAISGYGPLHEIEFDEPLFDVGPGNNPEWAQPTVRLGYTSFVTPSTVLDYSVDSGQLSVLKRQPVLGGYDQGAYEQARDWAVAADGTEIPVSLVWRRDRVTPGEPAPTLLYGYGSYEASMDPGFSIARLSLLDRGMVFAIAHVRGGGEMGRHWYDAGKMLSKKNSFSDFVAVAEHLIQSRVTTPQQLVAEGRSAGGLLMGAVANSAPHLFAGILAGVPFVDALTSILDPELPLTVIEWDEWGDPLHDPEVYEYMRSYSPYENVRADVAYPRILAVTSFNDTRVLYVEPAKWVAKLREVGAPVLLKTELSAGHGGASGRYDAWRERAFEFAWVLDVSGAVTGLQAASVPGTADRLES